jgi:hypothetical protein
LYQLSQWNLNTGCTEQTILGNFHWDFPLSSKLFVYVRLVTSIKSKLIEEKIKISICDFTEIDAQRKIMLILLIEFKKVTSGDEK